jgi:hypothetical protein
MPRPCAPRTSFPASSPPRGEALATFCGLVRHHGSEPSRGASRARRMYRPEGGFGFTMKEL